MTRFPWRLICDLVITAADGSKRSGTAWFVSPTTLVTAGHCISVKRPGTLAHGPVLSIQVMPARNGETSSSISPFGWVEVPRENLRVHPGWSDQPDINLDFDYGAILLPNGITPLGTAPDDWFLYGHYDDRGVRGLIGNKPILAGYPDDEDEGTQWAELNLIRDVTSTRVFYDIFTAGGQSGSPVFFKHPDLNRYVACAIHNWGARPFNSGVRINPEVVQQLDIWKQQNS